MSKKRRKDDFRTIAIICSCGWRTSFSLDRGKLLTEVAAHDAIAGYDIHGHEMVEVEAAPVHDTWKE